MTQEFDVNKRKQEILGWLAEHPKSKVNDICKAIGGDKTTAVRIVTETIDAGEVIREKGRWNAELCSIAPKPAPEAKPTVHLGSALLAAGKNPVTAEPANECRQLFTEPPKPTEPLPTAAVEQPAPIPEQPAPVESPLHQAHREMLIAARLLKAACESALKIDASDLLGRSSIDRVGYSIHEITMLEPDLAATMQDPIPDGYRMAANHDDRVRPDSNLTGYGAVPTQNIWSRR